MPAIITHDLFGHDVYDNLYASIGGTRDEAQAFLLGNQGPDPLFYLVLSPRMRDYFRLGNRMHEEMPAQTIEAFRQSIDALDEGDRAIGCAYALGFLCHYTLDSTVHPLVYANQYSVCDAGIEGLTRDDGGEVHAVIESEFDELVLFAKREETIATFNPSKEILNASNEVLRIISAQYAYVALTVFGLMVPHNLFSTAVKNFRKTQKLFYSPSGTKRAALGRIEELVRPYSFLRSMSHRPLPIEESSFENAEHHSWQNPFTQEASTASFWDLYDQAQETAASSIAAFLAEDFSLQKAHEITDDRDFSGRPLG